MVELPPLVIAVGFALKVVIARAGLTMTCAGVAVDMLSGE